MFLIQKAMWLLAQLTEYVSAYLLLYDHLILHCEKVSAWICAVFIVIAASQCENVMYLF